MTPTAFAIQRPIATGGAFLVIGLCGLVACRELSVDLLPDIAAPRITVVTRADGLAAQEIERLVSTPLELQLGGLSGVHRVDSLSRQGLSMVSLSYPWKYDLERASLSVRQALSRIQDLLPEVADRPLVRRSDPGSLPVMGVAVVGTHSLPTIRAIITSRVIPRFLQLPSIASAELTSNGNAEIRVRLDPDRLILFGLTTTDVERALTAANQKNLYGGSIRHGASQLAVRVGGALESRSDVAAVPVTRTPGGTIVRLEDIGSVFHGRSTRDAGTLHNGQSAIGLLLYKEQGSSTLQAVEAVLTVLDDLRQSHPDLDFSIAFEDATPVRRAITSLVQAIALGSLIAVFVLMLFLQELRNLLLIAIAIPSSILATLLLCYTTDVTLNVMTLGGLALGVGLLVDNSIVVLENICRQHQAGKSAAAAARQGSEEIALAVMAAALTTIVVFVPIAHVGGLAGSLFAPQALTVSLALIASLVVSLTLLPMLAACFLRRQTGIRSSAAHTRLAAIHQLVLLWCLRHRALVLAASAALLVAGAATAMQLSRELLSKLEARRFEVVIETTPGTPYAQLERVAQRLSAVAASDRPSISTFATLGVEVASASWWSSGATRLAPNRGRLTVALDNRSAAPVGTLDAAREAIRLESNRLRGVVVAIEAASITLEGLLGFDPAGFRVAIRGNDLETLRQLALDTEAALGSIAGLADIKAEVEGGRPELLLRLRNEAMQRYGVATDDVIRTLVTMMQGVVPTELIDFDRRLEVRVLAAPKHRTLSAVLEHPYPIAGGFVPLRELFDHEVTSGPQTILRRDHTRQVNVVATRVGISLSEAIVAADEVLEQLRLTQGARFAIAGEQDAMEASFHRLARALILSVLLVYMVMAAQFESLLQPLVVLARLPLGWVGVGWALSISGQSANLPALIGLVVLTGIVVNDGIVKIDCINRLHHQGASLRDAVLRGSALRLRPIVMTSTTTVCALLPLAFGLGSGGQLLRPLAIAIIGGELTGTLLALLVLPVLYELTTHQRSGTEHLAEPTSLSQHG